MANNRLYIYDPETHRVFCIAKRLGTPWYTFGNPSDWVEKLDKYFEEVEDWEGMNGPTRLRLVTEYDSEFTVIKQSNQRRITMSKKNYTFEEIEKNLDKFEKNLVTNAPMEKSVKGVPSIDKLCSLYQGVRPILLTVTGMFFIPKRWRDYLKSFTDTLDMFCPNG